jgi:hypothetical protein
MSLQKLIPWLIGAMAISLAAMVSGAWSGMPMLTSLGALLFALAMVATSWHINRPLLNMPAGDDMVDTLRTAVRRNARMLGIIYLWGSAGLLAIYRGTSLRWQHGVQYTIGMALIGLLIFVWVRRAGRPRSRLVGPRGLTLALRAATVHALAAVGGLVFLIGSGKLASTRGDWAANQVFLAGGLAVVGVSIIAILTHLHLVRPGPAAAPVRAAPGDASRPST